MASAGPDAPVRLVYCGASPRSRRICEQVQLLPRFCVRIPIRTNGGDNDQVHRCCFCFGPRTLRPSNVARAASSTGRYDHASPPSPPTPTVLRQRPRSGTNMGLSTMRGKRHLHVANATPVPPPRQPQVLRIRLRYSDPSSMLFARHGASVQLGHSRRSAISPAVSLGGLLDACGNALRWSCSRTAVKPCVSRYGFASTSLHKSKKISAAVRVQPCRCSSSCQREYSSTSRSLALMRQRHRQAAVDVGDR